MKHKYAIAAFLVALASVSIGCKSNSSDKREGQKVEDLVEDAGVHMPLVPDVYGTLPNQVIVTRVDDSSEVDIKVRPNIQGNNIADLFYDRLNLDADTEYRVIPANPNRLIIDAKLYALSGKVQAQMEGGKSDGEHGWLFGIKNDGLYRLDAKLAFRPEFRVEKNEPRLARLEFVVGSYGLDGGTTRVDAGVDVSPFEDFDYGGDQVLSGGGRR